MNTYKLDVQFTMQGSRTMTVNANTQEEAEQIAHDKIIAAYDSPEIWDAITEIENCELVGE